VGVTRVGRKLALMTGSDFNQKQTQKKEKEKEEEEEERGAKK
jgi:hypothetical protein